MTSLSRRRMLANGISLAGMSALAPAAFAQPAGGRGGPGDAPALPPGTGQVERMDPALDALIDAGAPVERIMDGFEWSEGPVWVGGPDGYLLVSDPRTNIMTRWSAKEGRSVFLQPSGYQGAPDPVTYREAGSNGIFLGRGGIIIADSGTRAIVGINLDTKARTIIADRFEGKRLNSPNDLCVSPTTGAIYFTDPPYGLNGILESKARELDFTGVFRVDRDNSVHLIGRFQMPNGIGISPDGRRLYHTDGNLGWVVHDLDAQGNSLSHRPFIDRAAQGFGPKTGGDGFKVDAAGNLWHSGGGGINITNPEGKRLGIVRIGGASANCEIGADGYLYIAAGTNVMRVPVKTKKLQVA